jgi:hypothetical protein
MRLDLDPTNGHSGTLVVAAALLFAACSGGSGGLDAGGGNAAAGAGGRGGTNAAGRGGGGGNAGTTAAAGTTGTAGTTGAGGTTGTAGSSGTAGTTGRGGAGGTGGTTGAGGAAGRGGSGGTAGGAGSAGRGGGGGTAGGGGAAGRGGAGGAAGTGGTAGQNGNCGTMNCSSTQYCDWPSNRCGSTLVGGGACMARPQGCTAQVDPVCGCDGQVYSNSCLANVAGQDIDESGAGCTPPSGTFACGPRFCTRGSQYCESMTGGAVENPGGFACHALPAGCGAAPTCACLAGNAQCGNCLMSNGGDLTTRCQFP